MASHFAGPNEVTLGLKKYPWASVSPSANRSCCSLDGGKDCVITPVLKSSLQRAWHIVGAQLILTCFL